MDEHEWEARQQAYLEMFGGLYAHGNMLWIPMVKLPDTPPTATLLGKPVKYVATANGWDKTATVSAYQAAQQENEN